ncbi:hypothetical protein EBH_0078640 [Eimeria brunetti]|uniref:Secreted protein n=1 Tax=Eimeria brunetti TaxID=51314 RepID=U6LE57_9EIME|nr:hypothetical protein EBH_0078640 [Eimeria brunetti]
MSLGALFMVLQQYALSSECICSERISKRAMLFDGRHEVSAVRRENTEGGEEADGSTSSNCVTVCYTWTKERGT